MINSWKIVCSIIILNSVILSVHSSNDNESSSQIKIFCGNDNCTDVISTATTLYPYNPDEKWKIALEPKKKVKVLARYNNKNKTEYYKIQIGEAIGWAPKYTIKEEQIIIRKQSLKQVSAEYELILKLQGKKIQPSETSIDESQTGKETTPLPDTTENKIVTDAPDSIIKDNEKQPDASHVQKNVKIIDGTQIFEEWSKTTATPENNDSSESKSQNDQNLSKQNENKELENVEEKRRNETMKESSSDDEVEEKVNDNTGKNLNDSNSDAISGEDKKMEKESKTALSKIESENKVDMENGNQSSTNEALEKEKNQDKEKAEKPESVENEDQSSEKVENDENDSSKKLNEEKVESESSKESGDFTQFNNNATEQEDSSVNVKDDKSNMVNNTDEKRSETVHNQEHKESQVESNKNETGVVSATSKDSSEDKTKSTNEPSIEPKSDLIENGNSTHESKLENLNSIENGTNQADNSSYLPNSMTNDQKSEDIDYNAHQTIATPEPIQKIKNRYSFFPQVPISNSNAIPNDQTQLSNNKQQTQISNAAIANETTSDENQTEESTEQTQLPDLSQQITTDNPISYNEQDPNFEHDLLTTTVSYKTTPDSSPIEEKQTNLLTFTNTDDDNLTPPIEAPAEVTPQNPDIVKENTEVEDKSVINSVYEFISNLWHFSSDYLSSNNENKNDETLQDSIDNEKNKEYKENNNNLEYEYCEKLTPNSCPKNKKVGQQMNEFKHPIITQRDKIISASNEKFTFEYDFIPILYEKISGMIDVFVCLLITAITSLLFAFGYYCICNNRNENVLLSKLNIVERSLLASNKESLVLKHELLETRNKLTSIEDNSFGSNDMVIALKKELEIHREEKIKLQEQIAALEKELENAAEAGLELNKIVSELLSNQSGDDSIISSVEELQKQLNEQQNTISQINATLAEKSKENSELQLLISEQAIKFQTEINSLKQQNQDLENDKTAIVNELQERIKQLTEQLSKTIEEKSIELKKLNDELGKYKTKYEDINKKCQINTARVKVLEECLSSMKENPKLDIKNILDLTNLKTDNQVLIQERDSLKERLEAEMDNRKLLENRVKAMTEEVTVLKQEYDKSEKDKLEAQTRLEVLSGYFKEKETQLQKELSVKEAMWLKQQGETTNTVERVRLMQDEIQSLKSQNDSLRAEIEAQIAAHKAQITILENRAHETWVAARHSERKYEEARQEATILRRKLTSLSSNPIGNEADLFNRNQNSVDGLVNQINNTSSPIHMESPSSPLLSNLPPPPPFLPPPFMAPPHGFLPLPPPLVPPSELRPPPLGRLMSPPPPAPPHHGVYSQNMIDEERHRYSPDNGRFSPIDSNYNYNPDLMSAYDTETDFSLPPSPQNRTGDGGGGGYNSRERERIPYSFKGFSHSSPNSDRDRNKKLKGTPSSGSEDSYSSRKNKSKKM